MNLESERSELSLREVETNAKVGESPCASYIRSVDKGYEMPELNKMYERENKNTRGVKRERSKHVKSKLRTRRGKLEEYRDS